MNNTFDYEGSLRTDKNGTLMIYTKGAFDQFFKDHPNGAFTMKVQTVPKTNSGRTTAYYMAEVLPKIIKGFEALGQTMSKEGAMEVLKDQCKVNRKSYQEGENIKHHTVDFNELEYFEKRRHISEAIQFAAEELGTIIDEPI